MRVRKKYKFQGGIQRIYNDTPDYSKAYEIQSEQAAKNKGISQAAGMFSGAFAPVGQVGGLAADVIRNRSKNKKAGSVAGGAVEMGTSGAALGMQLGGPWGAAAGAVIGGVYGGVKGAKDYKKIKAAAQAEEKRVEEENFNKTIAQGTSTDAQSFLAKKGKTKVKVKQPRLIETEGREPIFSPKKADGTRDLLYYNPNDPTHEEGGVKAIVMPRRPSSKNSLIGSGKMAYGAKQVKVKELNDTSLSQNLGGMPAVNAANKFVQPMAGIQQVARNIPEYRRKATIKNPMSHKKENPDTNRIVDPPTPIEMRDPITPSGFNKKTLYEAKLPKPVSTHNTKNDYNKGSKKVKVYR